MKIAYVSQSYPPIVSGAALVVHRLAKGISAREHSVLILSSSDCGKGYTENKEGFEIVRLRSYKNPARVDHHFSLWPRNEIATNLENFQPDILHLHDPLNLGLSSFWAAKNLNIPTIITIHQLPWFISLYIAKKQLTKNLVEQSLWQYSNWFLRQCEITITPSRTIAKIIQSHIGIRPIVISNGVDTNLFTPQSPTMNETKELCSKYDIHPGYPVVLFVGRLDPDKNVMHVLKAIAKVLKKTKVQFLIVGDGTHREELIQQSKLMGIYQHCKFCGFIPQSGDLPGIYRLATLFITASEIEIQSSVVLESAASGLPIIAVNASSMPEFIEHGKNGYLVPPGDVDRLAKVLINTLKNPGELKKMGQAGRKLAEKHSNETSIDNHEQLYKTTIQKTKLKSQYII